MKMTKKPSEGHVYALVSPVCDYIKIGGSDYPPSKRLQELNASEPYKSLGPWTLHDFRQVADWRKVEYSLHYALRSRLVKSIPRQKELFAVSAAEASWHLEQVDESLLVKKPKIDRMFQDQEFSVFLATLFKAAGILRWLDVQGSWTFSLFPATNGGRYYTLNIGPHEVAFATMPSHRALPVQMIHMDRMVRDFKEIEPWVKDRAGCLQDDNYASGLYRSTSVFFEGEFGTAREFLYLQGVRRAIIAYWTEALIGLQETRRSSLFSKHHNWNAIAELKKRILTGRL